MSTNHIYNRVTSCLLLSEVTASIKPRMEAETAFFEDYEDTEEIEDINKMAPFLDSLEFYDSNTLSNAANLCSKEVISRIESHVLMFLKMLTEEKRLYELQPVFC